MPTPRSFCALFLALPGLAVAAEMPRTPALALAAWAKAYASNQGPPAAALYAAGARLSAGAQYRR